MQPNHWLRAGVLTLFIVVSFFAGWELWLRHKGYSVTYDDAGPLWADKRGQVYDGKDKEVVFIGSSRIKFDLDIPTWEKATGLGAVQLALQGTNPVPVLHHLAEDPSFNGKLVVDVTEILFFSQAPPNLERADKELAYYKKYTPAQKASFVIDHGLESQLVFLDQDFFSLTAMMNRLPVPKRPGVFPGLDFPWEFDKCYYSRQSGMDPRFLADTNLQNKVRGIWAMLAKMDRTPPPKGSKLDSALLAVKTDVDKIKARGGEVLFVRTPSSGPFWQGEQMGFPREQYWDRILAVTGCQGVHFKDYDAIAHFECPEFSHLKPTDAVLFTTELVRILREKGFIQPAAVVASR